MKYNKLQNKGFSLIELMVSIAIVAILTALIIVNIASSRAKARDAKRISDIAQIQLALEQYFTKFNIYPTSDEYAGTSGVPIRNIVPNFLSKIPVDPNGPAYVYAPDTVNNYYDYILSAELENKTSEGLTSERLGVKCDPEGTIYGLGFIYCVSSK